MSILSRYVLRSHLAPAGAGLAIFYFVLSMDFIVDYLDLFIAKGVPGLAVLEAFGLSLAWMTLLAVPMSVMVGVLTAFGRLAGDNEITAAKSTGVGVLSLITPVLLASLLIAAGVFQFGNQFLPTANHRLKALLVDIHRIRPLATIEPGILTRLPGGYRIMVGSLDAKTSEIFDVRIHRMEGDDPLQTVVASTGTISTGEGDGTIRIQLLDGEIHELDPDDPTRYSRLVFERHTINVDQGTSELVRTERAKRGDREMTVAELRNRISGHRTEAEAARSRIRELLGAGTATGAAGTSGAGVRTPEVPDAHPASGTPAETEPVPETAAAPDAPAVALRTEAPVTDPEELERRIESETRTASAALRKARKLEVEYHKKFSIPFSCVVFVLLGAPLGIRTKRGGVGIGAGIGILFFLVYYLFLIGGEQLGDRGIVSPFWAMWAPNVVFGGVGIFLTLSIALEWRVRGLTRVVNSFLRAPATSFRREPKA